MKRGTNSQLAPGEVRRLRRVRSRLKKRLNTITIELQNSAFSSELDDLNFALVQQQIIQARLNRLEEYLKTKGVRVHRPQP